MEDRQFLKWMFIMVMLQSTAPILLIAYADLYIPTGLISVLISTTPLFTLIIQKSFFPSSDDGKLLAWIRSVVIIGIFGGLLGAVMVCIPQMIVQSQQNTPAGDTLIGIVMGVGSSLSWACAGILNQQKLNKFPALIKAWYAQVINAIVTFILAFIVELPFGTMRIGHTPNNWGWIMYLGCITSFASVFFNFFLFDTIGPVLTTSVWYLVPFVGLFIGAIFESEWSDFSQSYIILQCLGCVVIVIGLILSVFPKIRAWWINMMNY